MDKYEALGFLKRLGEGLTTMFGGNCEVVVHDMDNFERSILYIANGHVTQRTVGDKFSILGIKDVDQFFAGTDLVNCKAKTQDQRSLKSSTFHLKGDDYHYALGINFDYTTFAFAQTVLDDLTNVGADIDTAIATTPGPEDILENLFIEALRSVGKPVALLNKTDRLAIVRFLNSRGAFSMQKSIPWISSKLDISRHTVYNYLKEIREP